MFAIPGQTMEIWRATLAEAIALGSEHLSSYEVIYEEDTPLYAQLQAKEFDVDEDLACEMYEELVERATGAGFRQYEIANFARDVRANDESRMTNGNGDAAGSLHSSFVIRHSEIPTLRLQTQRELLARGSFYGLGPSATGYVRGVRTKNWSNTQLVLRAVGKREAGD